jgi:competence protein ComEA
VYRLPAGARVIDAVAAAGGAAAGARLDAINLATPLRDGDRLYVPLAREVPAVVPGVSSSSGEGASGGAQGPVNLNTATLEQLQTLPGVGPATAAAIVSHRERNGPFASVEALGDVHGIGPAKLDVLRPLVSI